MGVADSRYIFPQVSEAPGYVLFAMFLALAHLETGLAHS